MKSKIINPNKYISKEEILKLPIVFHEEVPFRKWVKDETYILNGSCQCPQDCNCSEMAGQVAGKIVTYYRKVEFDNTDKAFYEDITYTPKPYTKL